MAEYCIWPYVKQQAGESIAPECLIFPELFSSDKTSDTLHFLKAVFLNDCWKPNWEYIHFIVDKVHN
jgi:hypothetical protein